MGIVICKKHGYAGFVELCPHAAAAIANDDFRDFRQIKIFGTLLACDECFLKYDMARFENCPSVFDLDVESLNEGEEIFEAYVEMYERLEGRRINCSECVAAAEVSKARKEGRPDPFPVFERTLTSHQRTIIDGLKEHLVGNFNFQQSVVDDRKPGLFIESGSYRHPLTVTAYYVTAAQDQDRIVSLVSNFLKDVELNQCRIVFLEAEEWKTWSPPDERFSGGSRGREKLLREVFLNR